MRSYKYPPALKDRIERQVETMLQQGVIRPNSSSFSSPVLLVRKKDGSYLTIESIGSNCLNDRNIAGIVVNSDSAIGVNSPAESY